jgi:membrane-bound lytic murein transglycosylase A
MSSEEMSLQSIRSYLRDHPEVREDVLWHNESYVFFRWLEDGPVGSINVPLTAGRSIATDFNYYPRGALAFLESEKPRLDANGRVIGWEPLHRWVVNQDTGGAIKGAGRVDLFCGSGETAEWVAGRLKHPGSLYFLVKREVTDR